MKLEWSRDGRASVTLWPLWEDQAAKVLRASPFVCWLSIGEPVAGDFKPLRFRLRAPSGGLAFGESEARAVLAELERQIPEVEPQRKRASLGEMRSIHDPGAGR